MNVRCPQCSKFYRISLGACPECWRKNARSPGSLLIVVLLVILAGALIMGVVHFVLDYSTDTPSVPVVPARPVPPSQGPVFGTPS